jgi:hypothetical protein
MSINSSDKKNTQKTVSAQIISACICRNTSGNEATLTSPKREV